MSVEAAAPSPHATRALAFRATGLTKTYQMGETLVHALRGTDLEVYRSEIVVLLGPSGSGKSTLLNILGGLDRASGGQLLFGDTDLTAASDRQLTEFRRGRVGFIFQFYNLIPSLTARENVTLVTDLVRDPMPADEALDLVGLKERADHFPAQLSGGEQQRVAVARAVAKRPEVLLCDEPTGALDSATGVRVLQALAEVNQRIGTTTALITHNVAIAAMGDRVIHFANGCVSHIEVNATRADPAHLRW